MTQYSKNILTKSEKREVLNSFYKSYHETISYIGADEEPNIFSIKTGSFRLWVIQIYVKNYENLVKSLFFIEKVKPELQDIIVCDLRNVTQEYEIQKEYDDTSLLSKIIEKELIDVNSNNIIAASVQTKVTGSEQADNFNEELFFRNYPKNFAEKEYENAKNNLNAKQVDHIDYNEQRYFAEKFQFRTVLNTIDNSDFTLELQECLFAYNNEKWFLCAAGLGSVLEHLMLLTIQNYNNKQMLQKIGRQPTARDLISAFQLKPINMSTKQERYIRCMFELRNCVSHYSTGFTEKGIVDMMLTGLKDIFNDFYIDSLDFKQKRRLNNEYRY